MAFKFKTGKTVNKILAGAGIVALVTGIGSVVAPQFMGSPMAKAVEGIAAYGVGGVESVIGAAASMMIGSHVSRGARSLDNTLTESL
jgi:hypothetical protein